MKEDVRIAAMTETHPLWAETRRFAESCSWRAGPVLAQRMSARMLTGWERVFGAWVNGQMACFCTLASRDELPEEYDLSPFIGFVFVGEAWRGRRLSERLIDEAARYDASLGFERVYLLSGEQGLYEKYGFDCLGEVTAIYGSIDQLFVRSTAWEKALV